MDLVNKNIDKQHHISYNVDIIYLKVDNINTSRGDFMETDEQKRFKFVFDKLLKLTHKNIFIISSVLAIGYFFNRCRLMKKFLVNSVNNLKYKKVIIILGLIIIIFYQIQANDSVRERVLTWTDEIFKTNINRKEINIKSSETKTYDDFKSLEKDLNISILKPSYIPKGYKLTDINLDYDPMIHITARYLNESQEAFIYSIYIITDTYSSTTLLQEKTGEDVKNYKLKNGMEVYLIVNTDWLIGTVYDIKDDSNDTIYSIQGLKSEDELKKFINGLK